MPLVVEDGIGGNPDANAYIGIAYADDYHDLRGNSRWTAASAGQRASAIVRATDYIDKRFQQWFLGTKLNHDQGLAWPRLDALDRDRFLLTGIPTMLKRATAEYALRALVYVVLAPDAIRPVPSQSFELGGVLQSTDPVTPGRVTRVKEVVGPLETQVDYDHGSKSTYATVGQRNQLSGTVNDDVIPAYPEADMWIETMLEDRGSISTVRA